MEEETIKKALVTPPLTFSLSCDKREVTDRKVNCRITIFPQAGRKKERKKGRKEGRKNNKKIHRVSKKKFTHLEGCGIKVYS